MAPVTFEDRGKAGSLEIDHKEVVNDIQQASEDDESIWRLLRKHWRVIGYTFLANSSAFLFGFDVLVQGAINALPMFSVSYGSMYQGRLILPALWQGLWLALNAAGIMAGAAGNGWMMDKFGRRPMFFLGGVISAIGTAAAYVSADPNSAEARRGVLVLGKFIIGYAMGIMMSTGQTFVSEISPPRLRTILLGIYPFFITIGQMMAISVVFSRVAIMDKSAFKVPFASQWAFAGYAILASILLPESPVYLALKGNVSKAEKSLERLGYTDPGEQISIILSTAQQENGNDEPVTYAQCFKGSDWRRTRIVALLNSLQQFLGMSLIANSTYFFIMAGMNPKMSLTINQVGVGISMICTLISWVIITHVGRRMAILASFVVAGAVHVGMGVAGLFPQNPRALTFIGAALVIVASCANLGLGTAYPIASAEIPSTRLRAKSLGIGFMVNAFMTWVFALTVPYMFNADAGNLGGKIGFVFAGFCVLGFVLTWLEVPETKDLTYARIDELFKLQTPTRKFTKEVVVDENSTP